MSNNDKSNLLAFLATQEIVLGQNPNETGRAPTPAPEPADTKAVQQPVKTQPSVQTPPAEPDMLRSRCLRRRHVGHRPALDN